MSTVTTSQTQPPQSPDETNPFRYGWRYVQVERPDGSEDVEQVPLTLEDVLHPLPGDFIVNSAVHNNDVTYLKNVFKSRLAKVPNALVLSDTLVDWNVPDEKGVGRTLAYFSASRSDARGTRSMSWPRMRTPRWSSR